MDEGEVELHKWFEAARSGDASRLEAMLDEGFWAEAVSPLDGMTALMVACAERRLECVELLIQNSDVDARDEWGNTALLVAAAAGNIRAVEMLIKAGADGSVKNAAGMTFERATERGAAKSRR